KARRLNNYDILKRVLQGGTHVELEDDRLEVHVRNSPINANLLNLSGKGSASEIVLYPLPPFKGSELYFIAPTYGQTHNIENIRIRSVEKNYLYETYDCILKPSGVSNEIQITGEVRDGFWDDMEPGKEIFINWTFETQGQTRVVDSFDSETGIIVTTTNLPA